MKKLAEEWLQYADKDLKTIDFIIKDPYLTNVVAFHSHQCIEKSFKALILYKTEDIPKIHNLIRLYGTVRNYNNLEINISLLEEISETYIDTRYPSDMGLLPNGSLSEQKAKLFYEETKSIFSQIEKIII